MVYLNRYLAKFRAHFEEVLRLMPASQRQEYLNLRSHYMDLEDVTLQDSYRYAYTVAVIMNSGNYTEALQRIGSESKVSLERTSDVMFAAINKAPAEWKDAYEGKLDDRGIVRGLDKFYKVKRQLAKGSLYDEHKNLLPAETKPLVKAAIDCLYNPENEDGVYVTPSSLGCMIAYLLPDELQRQNLLADIRKKKITNIKGFENDVSTALTALALLSRKYGLDVYDKQGKIPSDQSEKPFQANEKIVKEAQAKQEVKDFKELSQQEVDVYVAYRMNETGNKLHDTIRVVSLFSRSERESQREVRYRVTPEFLRATVSKVEDLLKGREAKNNSSVQAGAQKKLAL